MTQQGHPSLVVDQRWRGQHGIARYSAEVLKRLDLYYVENWSLSADFLILARTAKAVVKPGDTAI